MTKETRNLLMRYKETLVEQINLIDHILEDNPEGDFESCLISSNHKIIESKVNEYCTNLGILPNIKGYAFIKESLTLILTDFDKKKITMRLLYSSVSKKFNETPSKVERAIRHAIALTFERGNKELLEQFFGKFMNPTTQRVSNSEFLFTIN